VTTFMYMLLNGEMRRTANHKMTVSVIRRWFCVNISQFSESDQSFCARFFNYINISEFVSPRIHCIWILLD